MRSFRHPVTNVLKAFGYCETNAVGDVIRDEPDDFNLEPGKWALTGGVWTSLPPNPNVAINAQIASLEASSMLNRGSREMEIYLIEKEAREYSTTYGLTMEVVLSGNSYYPKLKALDASAAALRAQLI